MAVVNLSILPMLIPSLFNCCINSINESTPLTSTPDTAFTYLDKSSVCAVKLLLDFTLFIAELNEDMPFCNFATLLLTSTFLIFSIVFNIAFTSFLNLLTGAEMSKAAIQSGIKEFIVDVGTAEFNPFNSIILSFNCKIIGLISIELPNNLNLLDISSVTDNNELILYNINEVRNTAFDINDVCF